VLQNLASHNLSEIIRDDCVYMSKKSIESAIVSLNTDKICPGSSAINKANNNTPPPALMHVDQLLNIVKYWHEINCPQKDTCQFASIGQHLLHIAMKRNQTLLTVQVGAMDGRSNDPMYEMFVETMGKNYVQARKGEIGTRRNSHFSDLRNWLPVMIEPVPQNYNDAKATYLGIANDGGLGCAVPIHAAVSYDSTKTACPFCRFNTADDAPDRCKKQPDWMKLQIGTLDCEHSKRFFADDFDLCILQDPLPCSSLMNLLSGNFVPSEHIAMLQIDIEGYEYILLDGMLKEMPDSSLPPVIHFEHKVMIDQDEKHPLVNRTSRIDHTKGLLSSRGYYLYDEGEDYLALRLDVHYRRSL